MKYLFVKMRRDLIRHWTQFFSVFMMAFLALLIYVGMEGTWCGMRTELNRYFTQTNLASAWVYGNGMTAADMAKVKKISGVADAEPVALYSAKAQLPEVGGKEPDLQLSASPGAGISKPIVVSGASFSASDSADGIWLDSEFAKANRLSVGGKLSVCVGDVTKTLLIKGLVMSAEYICYTGSSTEFMPNHRQHGFAVIGTGTAEDILNETVARAMQKDFLPSIKTRLDSAFQTAHTTADTQAEQIFGAKLAAQKQAALQTALKQADALAEQAFEKELAAKKQSAYSAAVRQADEQAQSAVDARFLALAPSGVTPSSLPAYSAALAQAKTQAEAKARAAVDAQFAAGQAQLDTQLAQAKASAEKQAEQAVEKKFASMQQSLDKTLASVKAQAESAARDKAAIAVRQKLGVTKAQYDALNQMLSLPDISGQRETKRAGSSAQLVSLLLQMPDKMLSRSINGFSVSTLKQEPLDYNMLRLKTNAGTDTRTVEDQAQTLLGGRYTGFTDQTTFRSVASAVQKTGQIQKMSILFSAIFILLALLTMQTTMTRVVDTQRTVIGTLKALGFGSRQIRAHYISYGLSVGLLGSVLGLAIAPFTISPLLLRSQANSLYTLPAWPVCLTWASFAVVALVAGCCTLATLLACRRGLSGMPAETMRGPAPKAGRQLALEKAPALWRRIGFGWKWTLRDISRSKVRSVMGMVGVLGCMMLLIASFGMQNTDDGSPALVYGRQYTYAVKAVLSSDLSSDRDALYKTAGGGQWVEEDAVEYQNVPASETGLLTVVGSGNYVHLFDASGAALSLPQTGVIVTQRTARVLGLKKGDFFTFRVSGEKNYLRAFVAGVAVTPLPQGVFVSTRAWKALGRDFEPTALLSGNAYLVSTLNGLSYIREVTTSASQLSSTVNNIRSFSFIFLLLKFAAILLDVVILYNLGILSFTERTREYATLKVLGFYQKEIRSLALRENMATTLAGWLIGIPVGLWFLSVYVGAVSTPGFDMTPKLTPLDFLLATLITVGSSTAVNLFLSRKVRRIDMVAALKSVE